MNNLKAFLLSLFSFLFSSCSSSKPIEETPKQTPQNPIEALCFCKNTQGQILMERMNQQQKQMKLSDEEMGTYLMEQLQNPKESWLVNDFLKDDVFMNELKKSSEQISIYESRFIQKWMNELEQTNPKCKLFFSIMPMMIVPPK